MYTPLKSLVFGAALAMSASAFAAANKSFSEWDSNNDNMLSKEEFQSGMRGHDRFKTWDSNQDGYLDRTEYSKVGRGSKSDSKSYDDWDSDKDERLSEDETYGGTFSSYDKDENGHWDGDEWDDAGDEGWFDY